MTPSFAQVVHPLQSRLAARLCTSWRKNLIIVFNGTAASGYTPEPECVLSPRLDEMSDEVADIRVQTLHSLASASEDRYAQQLRRCWARAHRVVKQEGESSQADQKRRIADFHARQFDLFRPQQSWDDEF